jgi:hypothetical protein
MKNGQGSNTRAQMLKALVRIGCALGCLYVIALAVFGFGLYYGGMYIINHGS